MVPVWGILCLKYFKKNVKSKKLNNFFQHIIESMASKDGGISDLENKLAGIEINHDHFSIEKFF